MTTPHNTVSPRPLAVSITEASRLLGLGRTKIHALIAAGELAAPRKVGTRSLFIVSDLERFLLALPKAGSTAAAKAR